MTGPLNPKSAEIAQFVLQWLSVRSLGHILIVHPVTIRVFSKMGVSGEVVSSHIEQTQK